MDRELAMYKHQLGTIQPARNEGTPHCILGIQELDESRFLINNIHKAYASYIYTFGMTTTPNTFWSATQRLIGSRFLNKNLSTALSSALAGVIFGFSISLGLGLARGPAFWLAVITGIGVLIVGSLSGYLFLQTTSLAFLSLVVLLLFRFNPALQLESGLVQWTLLGFLAISPVFVFIPRLRVAFGKLAASSLVQLIAALFFAILVILLRDRMPAHAGYALSNLYGMEDNAGIAGQLATSLDMGFTSHISGLGEVSNSLYIMAAGLTSQFGIETSNALLAPYTHWNLTLLLLAWIPLSALLALVASGKKTRNLFAFTAISVVSALLALLLWPFIGFGHTSVISASLFAIVLLGLTLNKALADKHPIVFLILVASLGFIIGNIWFPLVPFGAATVALTLAALLQAQYQKGNKRAVIFLVALFTLAFLALIPRVIELVSQNDSLIVLVGATRSASQLLILIWLALLAVAVWAISHGKKTQNLVGRNLFMLTLAALLTSNVYLVISGMFANAGSSGFGYGATKYLLTSVAFSIPLLWLVISSSQRRPKSMVAAVTGLALSFSVFISQPDHGIIISTGIIPVASVENPTSEANVVSAIREALETKPDHILCVSDKGQPMVVENAQWNSYQWEAYLCTRWADSLSANLMNEGFLWRSTMINSYPEETLAQVKETLKDKKVVIIRFEFPAEDDSDVTEDNGLWWEKYVDASWKVISVN